MIMIQIFVSKNAEMIILLIYTMLMLDMYVILRVKKYQGVIISMNLWIKVIILKFVMIIIYLYQIVIIIL